MALKGKGMGPWKEGLRREVSGPSTSPVHTGGYYLCSKAWIDQGVIHGEEGQFKAGGNSQLIENIREVMLHGLLADGEPLRDVAVTIAGNNGRNNFQLARSESKFLLARIFWSAGGKLAQSLDKVGDAVLSHP